MEYTKQTWTAPTGTGLSRYAKSGETETHVELALDPVNLTNAPTPFTMARMAHMEDGIAKAYDTAPPTPLAQYSGKDIPQLPDNVAGTTQKVTEFTSIPSGWVVNAGSPVSSFDDNEWQVVCDSAGEGYINWMPAGSVVIMYIKCISGSVSIRDSILGVVKTYYASDKWNLFIHYVQTARNVGPFSANSTYRIKSIYIGTGAYDRLVFDNSYHYRHLLNNAVVPTPQGLYFNGATSYLRSKEKITLPDVFTFSATVNCAVSTTSFLRIFDLYNSPTSFIQVFRLINKDLVIKYYNTVTSSSVSMQASNFFVDNIDIDTKIEIDFINETLKIYKNNILFYNVTVTGIQKPTEGYLYIGAENALSLSFLGYMRNICLFDTALTDTQRNWLAQGNTPPILYDVTNYKLGNADTASKANVRVSLRHGNMWFEKTWAGLAGFYGNEIWTDGENIYYSEGTNHYVLNKATSTWSSKTWTGLTDFSGNNTWTDGDNIYYNTYANHYVLNKATSTWSSKTWTGLTDFSGNNTWTDGDNIYYSNGITQRVLNKATSTWSSKTWNGFTVFSGNNTWTDGDNIYYSNGTTQRVLNKATSTWSSKTWNGLTNFSGNNTWTDGENIYYSEGTNHYVLNKATSTWSSKTWNGLTDFSGNNTWTDRDNIYYSNGGTRYEIPSTRHNYVDDDKYNSLFGTVTKCNCSTLSDRFVFRNE